MFGVNGRISFSTYIMLRTVRDIWRDVVKCLLSFNVFCVLPCSVF